MTEYIILNRQDMLALCDDKTVTIYIDNKPYVLCTDEYFEKQKKSDDKEMLKQEPKFKTFDVLRFVADNAGLSTLEAIEKAYNMGLCEQELCGDAISRQAVLDINEHHHGQMPNHVNHEIWEEIKALPSVKPQPKTGHWIPAGYYYAGAYEDIKYVKCSCCCEDSLVEGDYCPNCGAKMV